MKEEKKNIEEHRLIIAGFGGQGILTSGKLLAASCLEEGKEVTFLPSYGSEVRGGTANCHIVVSDDEIGSPAIDSADSLIILNEPSFKRFGSMIKSNGLILINSSMIDAGNLNHGAGKLFPLAATELASGLGNVIVANMIMLGAFIALQKLCMMETVETALEQWLQSTGKAANIEINIKALRYGAELAGS